MKSSLHPYIVSREYAFDNEYAPKFAYGKVYMLKDACGISGRRLFSSFVNSFILGLNLTIFQISVHLTTFTVHVAVFPPIVTVIVVVPAFRAVIRPSEDTDAIADDLAEYLVEVLVAFSGFMAGMSW